MHSRSTAAAAVLSVAASAIAPCVQAVYRAAKAALKLKRYSKVIELCKEGLAVDPAASELAHMQDVSVNAECIHKKAKTYSRLLCTSFLNLKLYPVVLAVSANTLLTQLCKWW